MRNRMTFLAALSLGIVTFTLVARRRLRRAARRHRVSPQAQSPRTSRATGRPTDDVVASVRA